MATVADIDVLKSEGRYAEAGALAFALGQPRAYGCHFGMRSELQSARAAFEAGYDAAANPAPNPAPLFDRSAFRQSPRMTFLVTADHVAAEYRAEARVVTVSATVDHCDRPAFYAECSPYGCSRDYPSVEAAILGLLTNNGCTYIRVSADPACPAAVRLEQSCGLRNVDRLANALEWLAAHAGLTATAAEIADLPEGWTQDGADFYGPNGWTQDGADFYGPNGATRTAPLKVRDSDMEAARLAREWFRQTYSPVFSAYLDPITGEDVAVPADATTVEYSNADEPGYRADPIVGNAADMLPAAPKPAKPRAYRGKHPGRIRSIGGLTGRPGVYMVETNDGRKFEANGRALERDGWHLNNICGRDVADILGNGPRGMEPAFRPFRVGFSRAMAALYRVRRGADQTVPSEGVTPRDIALACLKDARRDRDLIAMPADAQFAYAAADALALSFDASGKHDWSGPASAAAKLLHAMAKRAQVRALRRKHESTGLLQAYRAHRARQPNAPTVPATAEWAHTFARQDLAGVRSDWSRRPVPAIGHGDLLRYRGPNGSRRNFVVVFAPDDDATPPWERADGHGPVSGSKTRDKLPGQRRLAEGLFYHWQEATRIAKADGWGLAPDVLAEFARKLGRTPTRKQVAAEAVRRDFEFLRSWCNDEWNYVGVCLVEMGRMREPSPHTPEEFADGILSHNFYRVDIAASVWGAESNATEYLGELAEELLSQAVARKF